MIHPWFCTSISMVAGSVLLHADLLSLRSGEKGDGTVQGGSIAARNARRHRVSNIPGPANSDRCGAAGLGAIVEGTAGSDKWAGIGALAGAAGGAIIAAKRLRTTEKVTRGLD